MKKLETIPFDELDVAVGGKDNTTSAKGNIGVDAKGVKVGIQAEYNDSRTNYAQCLSTMLKAGAKPEVIASTCGKPGS